MTFRIQHATLTLKNPEHACYYSDVPVSGVTGQNGSGQNGTDKMVYGQNDMDKMVWTKWYGQNGTILYFVSILNPLNSIYI